MKPSESETLAKTSESGTLAQARAKLTRKQAKSSKQPLRSKSRRGCVYTGFVYIIICFTSYGYRFLGQIRSGQTRILFTYSVILIFMVTVFSVRSAWSKHAFCLHNFCFFVIVYLSAYRPDLLMPSFRYASRRMPAGGACPSRRPAPTRQLCHCEPASQRWCGNPFSLSAVRCQRPSPFVGADALGGP